MGLEGQVALVTGAARGIGKAYAEGLLTRGAKVYIVDILEMEGTATANEFKERYGDDMVVFKQGDLTDMTFITKLHESLVADHGQLDILINNAGVGGIDLPIKTAVYLNTLCPVVLTELVVKTMRKDEGGKGGIIVNIGSIAALILCEDGGVYHATKTAVVAFTSSLGHFLPDEADIQIVTLNPTFVDTDMTSRFKAQQEKGNPMMDDIVDMCGGWVGKSYVVDTCMRIIDCPDVVSRGSALYIKQDHVSDCTFTTTREDIDATLLESLGGPSLEGKVAIVTGAARGIGRGFVEALLQRGAKVVFTDIQEETGQLTEQKLRDQYGKETVSFQLADVTNIDRMREVKDWTLQQYGRFDILINNAGVGAAPSTTQFDVNMLAPMLLTEIASEHMRTDKSGSGGTIINMGSLAGVKLPGPGNSLYTGSKHGLVAYTVVQAFPLKSVGVDLHCICPGFVNTEMVVRVKQAYDEGHQRAMDIVNSAGGWVDLSRVVATCMMCLEKPEVHRPGYGVHVAQDSLVHIRRKDVRRDVTEVVMPKP